jgi:hypothetical protein
MKKSIKSIVLAFGMLTFTMSAFSQGVSASANATATIIAPIAISNTTALAFGNVAVGTLGGNLTVSTAGARTATGDVSYQSVPAATAAAFTVTGSAGLTYAITLPADGTVTITSGANSMAVNTFISNPAVGSNPVLVAGPNALAVGATLVVGASQANGAYTGTFNVTVGYN